MPDKTQGKASEWCFVCCPAQKIGSSNPIAATAQSSVGGPVRRPAGD
jgi:hypothetical protein